MLPDENRDERATGQSADFANYDPASMLEWIISDGQEHRAYEAIKQGDYEKARQLLEPLAARGSVYALLTLGGFYEAGEVGPPEIDTALTYYEGAASQGSVEALRRVARLLLDQGEEEKARAAFKRGAEAGNISCMYWLGSMMLEGQGGPADVSRGTRWLESAAAGGHLFAKRDLLATQARKAPSFFDKLSLKIKIALLAIKAGKGVWKEPDSDRHR